MLFTQLQGLAVPNLASGGGQGKVMGKWETEWGWMGAEVGGRARGDFSMRDGKGGGGKHHQYAAEYAVYSHTSMTSD